MLLSLGCSDVGTGSHHVAVERNIRGMGQGDQLIPWSELPK